VEFEEGRREMVVDAEVGRGVFNRFSEDSEI
jgi:hypothetical protein